MISEISQIPKKIRSNASEHNGKNFQVPTADSEPLAGQFVTESTSESTSN